MKGLALAIPLALLAGACTMIQPEEPVSAYDPLVLQKQGLPDTWAFQGRISFSSEKDSFSASLNWTHQASQDQIELAGPLSQGRVLVLATAEKVLIDDGEHPREFAGNIDEVMAAQLGLAAPVSALKFWVRGVAEQDLTSSAAPEGFEQAGWNIRYKEMQQFKQWLLPRKINAEKDKTRIKLIIDQWD